MKPHKNIIICFTIPIFLIWFIGCTSREMVKHESAQSQSEIPPRIFTLNGDTISYAIEFYSAAEREKFLSSFKAFLKDYPFAKLQDNGDRMVFVKILPIKADGEEKKLADELSNKRSDFVGKVIQNTVENSLSDSVIKPEDTIEAQYGGTIKMYTPRSTIDEGFESLVDVYPFENNTGANVLTIADSSPKKITLRLNGKITNGKGKILSALDFIESWNTMIKTHPAESFALFRYVDGIKEYIDGREAVVRGLIATDQNTIQLRLSQPDQYAIDRLRTGKLLNRGLMLGEYYVNEMTRDEIVLLSNKASGKKSGYLDKIVLRMGGEANPLLSFSLKKYDAVKLLASNDLDYARNNLQKYGTLNIIERDRYFIACTYADPKLRQYLRGIINSSEILRNFVKAEGEPISSIENDITDSVKYNREIGQLGLIQPVKILFQKDDDVSKIIAEKIMAYFAQDNIAGTLAGVTQSEYERVLISKNYGCAIGWVSGQVISDRSIQLHLASMWFNDELDEQVRKENLQEIPLFSVNKYLLTKNTLILPENKITEMFLTKTSQGN